MQTPIKRDFKIKDGKIIQNFFNLKNQGSYVVLSLYDERKVWWFSVEINTPSGSVEQRWGLVSGQFGGLFLWALTKQAQTEAKRLVKKGVFRKYSSPDFKVGES